MTLLVSESQLHVLRSKIIRKDDLEELEKELLEDGESLRWLFGEREEPFDAPAESESDDIDEDDLMDELDALEDELGEEELEGQTADAEGALPAYMAEPDLPSAPQALPAPGEGLPAQEQPQAAELENYGLQP